MIINRKVLNKRQTELRKIMMAFDQHDKAIQLFLQQHAMLHSAKMTQSEAWSYEDEILDGMTEAQIRCIPQNGEHSVAWCLWHIARIEDVTMNLLVASSLQVLHQENWLERLQLSARDTGNALPVAEIAAISDAVDTTALRAYRLAVGRRTRKIVRQLKPDELKQKVHPDRVQQVMAEKAVREEARGIVDYWRKRNIAGLLLMPPTRHALIHLNEASRIKQRLK